MQLEAVTPVRPSPCPAAQCEASPPFAKASASRGLRVSGSMAAIAASTALGSCAATGGGAANRSNCAAPALALARASDLVASMPERYTGNLRTGLHSFALPMPMAPIAVSMLWHPRLDADPAHRWLRGCVREVCAARG